MTEINDLVQELTVAKDFYFNGKPIMSDEEYDALEQQLRILDPDNQFFQSIGAAVRGEKVKLDVKMGSLDQLYSEEDLTKWLVKIDSDEFVVTAKLDGSSIQLKYDQHGKFIQAVTRGDGEEGLDVTRHFNRVVRSPINTFPTVTWPHAVIRVEALVTKDVFTTIINKNEKYRNPRNYAAGQLNRKVADQDFIDHVKFIAFDANIETNKNEIVVKLQSLGFLVPTYVICPKDHVGSTMYLEEMIHGLKDDYPYEIDGVVIDVNDANLREEMGFDGLNPEYARKYKINITNAQTEVVGVHWSISKHGYLKPRVEIEPVELSGVTITYATGFNAKFIFENFIGKGAVITVTRSGEVIPYIQNVVTPSDQPISIPESFGTWHWSENNTDAVLDNTETSESRVLQLADFFAAIDAPVLRKGNVQKLYDAGFDTIESVILASEDDLVAAIGENGRKAYIGLRDKLNPIEEWKVFGALPIFGRGIGQRMIKKIYEKYPMNHAIVALNKEQLLEVDGFEEKSVEKVLNGLDQLADFVSTTKDYISYKEIKVSTGRLSNTVVCFTGVRSKDLESIIENNGGKVVNTLNKDVTHLVAKDPNGKSTKLDKARKNGTIIMSLDQAKEMWNG